ncbi:MAG: hypothetical protein AAFV93_01875 [Chloroflexota bacterium]
MTDYRTLGNPVDTWWNHTRQHITVCIDLLANFPPAPNSQTAVEMIPAVRRARLIVDDSPAPDKALQIQSELVKCLKHLEISLREQAVHGAVVKHASHNLAYHHFLLVCYYLLQRGVYEPEPVPRKKQRVHELAS